MAPALTLHVLPMSHPCLTAEAALGHKGLDFEKVTLAPGAHTETMASVYGAEATTVPGLLVDGEPVHGSVAILERLEALVPDPPLYPPDIAEAVHEAERWGDSEFQDLGRRLGWGSMHFRPESLGTFGGADPLDAAGTDYAIRFIRASWKYHGITAVRLSEDLAGLPDKLDHIDALAAQGVIGGVRPTAADLQIGATARVLLAIGDLRALMAGRAAETIARRWFPGYAGGIPAGAFPAGWVPSGP